MASGRRRLRVVSQISIERTVLSFAGDSAHGVSPFGAYANELALLRIRFTESPRELRMLRPDIAFPPGLQGVLNRALETSPASRYSTAGAFASALAGVASTNAGEAV